MTLQEYTFKASLPMRRTRASTFTWRQSAAYALQGQLQKVYQKQNKHLHLCA